jgi:ribosome-binding factor A
MQLACNPRIRNSTSQFHRHIDENIMPAKKSAKGPTQRMLRVGEMARHALVELLQRGEIIDPLIETTVISVSEVRMTPDLTRATAYISPLGVKDPEPVVAALNRHARFIRGSLGPALRQLRSMPQIHFRADTSFDNFSKIDTLLRKPEVVQDTQRPVISVSKEAE